MSKFLDGKSGIVTGASGGIGRAIALAASEAGGSVLACARNAEGLAATAALADSAPGSIATQVLDVTDESAVEEAVARADTEFGGIDFIVNNAGICDYDSLAEATAERWREVGSVNVEGVLWGCKHAISSMLRRGRGGAVVNIGSTASLVGWSPSVTYTMSKHAVLGLTRAIADDRGISGAGIRCVCVCPGDTLTPMTERAFAATPDPDSALAEAGAAFPVGRIGRPEEVADLVVFLCSDRASVVHGAAVMADLGQLAGLT